MNSSNNILSTDQPRSFYDRMVESWFADADIQLNNGREWDIHIHNPQFPKRVMRHRSLGLGESYMEGWWDCDSLDEMFYRINLKERSGAHFKNRWQRAFSYVTELFLNHQSQKRAYHVGQQHYDIGNELFETMLDPYMQYSCGYWKTAASLDQAQENKLDLICRKLKLQKGMKLLDIGCGWGGLASFAAENYGVNVLGITISEEQKALIHQRYPSLPITVLLEDYRKLSGQFDRIVSVGMFEHVGSKNYATYFKVAANCLKPDGLFLLHTIGGYPTKQCDPWIHKYIFPNGHIPSATEIAHASNGLLTMEDWHNFGPDYDKTLMAWCRNFEEAWPSLKNRFPNKYDQPFYRMWRYYLLQCAGAFRARTLNLWQIIFRPECAEGRYDTAR